MPSISRHTTDYPESSTPSKSMYVKSDSRANVANGMSSKAVAGQGDEHSAAAAVAAPATSAASDAARPTFTRVSTLPDQHVLESPHNKERPLNQWRMPKSAKGNRAATLFLGKDYERWQSYDRDNLGIKLQWAQRSGSHSDVLDAAALSDATSGDDYEEGDDTDDGTFSEAALTDAESEASSSLAPSTKSSRRSSRSGRSRSGSGNWRRPGVLGSGAALHPLSSAANESLRHHDATRASFDGNQATPEAFSKSPSRRPRRFSSNGPEAAFLRHETVIGLHTPRRESASSSSASSFAGRQLPAGVERISLTPMSQIKSNAAKTPPSGRASTLDVEAQAKGARAPAQGAIEEHKRPRRESVVRQMSSSNMLKHAAEAAAASIAAESSESEAEERAGITSGTVSPADRALSPRPVALQLARRRKPLRVEGTLYDRSGPFREGAVTDGLSVRLFSADVSPDELGYENGTDSIDPATGPRHRKRGDKKKRKGHGHAADKRGQNGLNNDVDDMDRDSGVESTDQTTADDHGSDALIPQVKDATAAVTYLITTPDNRVSSAAKLRRWAMDGSGRFYAAMEIKSVEAKIRSATDQNDQPGGASAGCNAAYAKSLAKILRQTYLDDILNELQKAETLNPNSDSVSKLLVTSDGKYIRLEEDYPEEAFFVIAGCEEAELYPVVALIFSQALRHIHRFHSAGWMHGDIKLENLMFDSSGSLVVIDYENANPYRVPGGDGCVSLMSFDWVPPEAAAGPGGRRAGPGADLWALGANLVRAFALRDGIDDGDVREMLLESGQTAFLQFRDSLILPTAQDSRPKAEDVDLSSILSYNDAADSGAAGQAVASAGVAKGYARRPSPQRVLFCFAQSAPSLLRYVLASCLTLDPANRSIEAEYEGLRLAAEIEAENGGETMLIAQRAVQGAIQLSGSEWVRPKLDEARKSLGLGAEEEEEEGDKSASAAYCVQE